MAPVEGSTWLTARVQGTRKMGFRREAHQLDHAQGQSFPSCVVESPGIFDGQWTAPPHRDIHHIHTTTVHDEEEEERGGRYWWLADLGLRRKALTVRASSCRVLVPFLSCPLLLFCVTLSPGTKRAPASQRGNLFVCAPAAMIVPAAGLFSFPFYSQAWYRVSSLDQRRLEADGSF